MSDIVINSKTFPKVYYGLHFYPGLAGYQPPGKEPFKIYLNEQTLRTMDSSFCGKPVYVNHVAEVNLGQLQQEADGYVIESFYNQADGMHWVKFIVVSDKGHEAVRAGYRLSNAYKPESFAQGGIYNGIPYEKELTRATYEHLAIVKNPRYQESVIYTPTEFKEYNDNILVSLAKVANASDKENIKMFEFFKKSKIEKADDISDISVKVSNGKEYTVAELIALAEAIKPVVVNEKPEEKPEAKEPEAKEVKEDPKDKAKEKAMAKPEDADKSMEAPMMANMDHHVACEGGSMPLKQMAAEHAEMKNCMATLAKHMPMQNAPSAEDDQQPSTEVADEKPEVKLPVKNAAESFEAGIKTDPKFFNDLKNAHLTAAEKPIVIDLEASKRGRSRYGTKP